MRRVRIKELSDATGLSRATIDRALNGRGGVHQRTQQLIEEALKRLSAASSGSDGHELEPRRGVGVDFVLRLGRGLMEQLTVASRSLSPEVVLHDMFQRNDGEIVDLVRELCADPSRPLVVAAKNGEALRTELEAARRRGKRIVTLVSDLGHDARDGYVGIDNRMAGQTAAYLLGTVLRRQRAKAGVVIGDYSFSCHEDREIGFRSNLRAHSPSVTIVDEAQGEDSPERTYRAVADLLAAHPDLDAIYNVAGGNAGLARAVQEAGRAGEMLIITHEANRITAPLLREGVIHYLIAQHPADLLDGAIRAASEPTPRPGNGINLLDFGVYTKFNVPSYASWRHPSGSDCAAPSFGWHRVAEELP